MNEQAVSVTKKVGRPPKEASTVIRVPVSALETLDAWIAEQPDPKPSRPQAIRDLAAAALATRLNR